VINLRYTTQTGPYNPELPYAYAGFEANFPEGSPFTIVDQVNYGGAPAIRIRSSDVTVDNSYDIIPKSSRLVYACLSTVNDYNSVADWIAKPAWNLVNFNDSSNRKLIADTETGQAPGLYLRYDWNTSGILTSTGNELSVPGDGAVHVLAKLYLSW
jgi:hypothetical protein